MLQLVHGAKDVKKDWSLSWQPAGACRFVSLCRQSFE